MTGAQDKEQVGQAGRKHLKELLCVGRLLSASDILRTLKSMRTTEGASMDSNNSDKE